MNATLGDLLKSSSKKKLVKQRLVPGAIIFFWSDVTNPPKEKFAVIIGENENNEIGYFFINSLVNKNVLRNGEQRKHQVKIEKSDYDFLTRDSYIDCTDILKDKISEFESILIAEENFKGNLKDDKLSSIKTLLNGSRLYSRHKLKEFGIIE